MDPDLRIAAAQAREVRRFIGETLPRWREIAQAGGGAVDEKLSAPGTPSGTAERTTLTQARIVYTFAHLYMATEERWMLDLAREVHGYLDIALRDADGGYRAAALADGRASPDPAHGLRRSYDQSFALLALVTLRRAAPDAVAAGRVEACWRFIETRLTDPATGALWEDDVMAARGARPGELRAQNPHMHMVEALLQAYEMTHETLWRDRAARLIALALDRFVDPDTGAVREFVGHDLAPLDTADGQRREPGHQYEWAWLLHRFATLGGGSEVLQAARRMREFADRHGLRPRGPLAGLPYDALSGDGTVTEATHLLWPLTEAGKLHAALHADTGDAAHAARARALLGPMFARYFAADAAPFWVNRLDGEGRTVWPEALSRLLYHVALFLTEGARAGLWPIRPDRPANVTKEEKPR